MSQGLPIDYGTTEPLTELPVIDRALCRWKDYSRMGNYLARPGTHGYSARDCFVSGTLIETSEGQVPVEHIHTGHYVRTHLGNYHAVFETRSREVPETIEVKCYGNWAVQTTPEHPLWTKRGWVEAKHLTIEDYVGFPLIKETPNVETLYGLPVDAESMWVWGFYLAEGYLEPGKYSVTFTVSMKEIHYLDRIKAYATSHGFSYRSRSTMTALQLIVTFNQEWYEAIRWLFNHKSWRKRIHPVVLRLSTWKIEALLNGYFAGDGFVEKARWTRLASATVSRSLAIDLRNALLRLRVLSSTKEGGLYSSTLADGRVIQGRHTPYHLSVTKQFMGIWNRLLPTVGIPCPEQALPSAMRYNQQEVLQITDDYAWYKVRWTKPCGPATVYNFSVCGDQSYIADGLAVHNCWWRHEGGCTFCSWTNTFKNYRQLSVDQFMADVESAHALGVREYFDDAGTWAPPGKWFDAATTALCRFNSGRRHHRARICFGFNDRPGARQADHYHALAGAGSRFVLFGLESANYSTLERINKGQHAEDMKNAAKWASEAGLQPHLTVMFGYPWETARDASQTVALVHELFNKGWANSMQATLLMPYPGTRLFQDAVSNGWLLTEDWNRYTMNECILKCPMSHNKVLEKIRECYRAAVTPRYILKKVLTVRTRDDLRFFWRAFRFFYGHLTDFGVSQQIARVHALPR